MLLERTQRRLFRALFLLGCVLPTLATAGWVANRARPVFTNGLLERAGHAIGAAIACDRLGTPRPDGYELRNVTLRSTSHSTEFLRCDRVELASVEGAWRFRLGVVEVVDPHEAARWLTRVLESDLVAQGRSDRVMAAGDAVALLADVSIQLPSGDAGRRSLSLFEIDGDGRLQIANDDAGYTFEVSTGAAGVDAAWLPGQPLRGLADRIHFDGETRGHFDRHDDRCSAYAAGELQISGVLAGGLAAKRGALALEELAWNENRIERLHGRLDLREGTLSRMLVWGLHNRIGASACEHMLSLFDGPVNSFPFTQVACEVELDGNGLTIVGGCGEIDGRQRGGLIAHSIAEHEGEPLLREPRNRHLPAVALLQAWRPDKAPQLSATPTMLEAAQRLPTATRASETGAD